MSSCQERDRKELADGIHQSGASPVFWYRCRCQNSVLSKIEYTYCITRWTAEPWLARQGAADPTLARRRARREIARGSVLRSADPPGEANHDSDPVSFRLFGLFPVHGRSLPLLSTTLIHWCNVVYCSGTRRVGAPVIFPGHPFPFRHLTVMLPF